jgi:hypothetical protein
LVSQLRAALRATLKHDNRSGRTRHLAVVVPLDDGRRVRRSLGTAQWFVLRNHFPGAHQWVWANAVAWGAGLLVFTAVTTPLWQPGQPPELIALVGALGGLLMAVTGAALTLLRRRK